MTKKFRSFQDARKFTHSLKFKSGNEWREYCNSGNRPLDVPSNPNQTYKNEWKGMGDWLGTGTVALGLRQFRKFNDAKKYAQKLKLKNHVEWQKHCNSGNKPDDIPTKAQDIYKKTGEWKNWGDFLGTGTVSWGDKRNQYLSFEDARKFVRKLKLKNRKDWREYSKSDKRPNFIPASPEKSYKNNGWITMGNWLGTGFVSTRVRTYRSFKESKKFVKSLNLKGRNEWEAYCKSGNKPIDIPSQPWNEYSKKRKK